MLETMSAASGNTSQASMVKPSPCSVSADQEEEETEVNSLDEVEICSIATANSDDETFFPARSMEGASMSLSGQDTFQALGGVQCPNLTANCDQSAYWGFMPVIVPYWVSAGTCHWETELGYENQSQSQWGWQEQTLPLADTSNARNMYSRSGAPRESQGWAPLSDDFSCSQTQDGHVQLPLHDFKSRECVKPHPFADCNSRDDGQFKIANTAGVVDGEALPERIGAPFQPATQLSFGKQLGDPALPQWPTVHPLRHGAGRVISNGDDQSMYCCPEDDGASDKASTVDCSTETVLSDTSTCSEDRGRCIADVAAVETSCNEAVVPETPYRYIRAHQMRHLPPAPKGLPPPPPDVSPVVPTKPMEPPAPVVCEPGVELPTQTINGLSSLLLKEPQVAPDNVQVDKDDAKLEITKQGFSVVSKRKAFSNYVSQRKAPQTEPAPTPAGISCVSGSRATATCVGSAPACVSLSASATARLSDKGKITTCVTPATLLKATPTVPTVSPILAPVAAIENVVPSASRAPARPPAPRGVATVQLEHKPQKQKQKRQSCPKVSPMSADRSSMSPKCPAFMLAGGLSGERPKGRTASVQALVPLNARSCKKPASSARWPWMSATLFIPVVAAFFLQHTQPQNAVRVTPARSHVWLTTEIQETSLTHALERPVASVEKSLQVEVARANAAANQLRRLIVERESMRMRDTHLQMSRHRQRQQQKTYRDWKLRQEKVQRLWQKEQRRQYVQLAMAKMHTKTHLDI